MADEVASLVVRLAMSDSSFQQGIQNLNREMKVIDSEFKKVMSSSANFGTSVDGLKAKAQYLSDSMSNQVSVLQRYETQLKNTESKLKNIVTQQEQLRTKVEAAQQAWKDAEQQHGKNADVTQKLKEEYKQLSDEYTQNDKKIRMYVKSIDNQNIAINKAQTNINGYKQQLSEVQKEIEKSTSKFQRFQQNIDSIGKSMQTAGKQMSKIGKDMTTKITIPLTLAGGAAIKTGADFEQGMAKVSAISGATGSEFEQLEQKARQMGATTIFSASQAAEALNYMAMAGWQTQDMLDGLEGVMNLAAASGESLGTVSDIVTDSLTAFGLSAKDSAMFADVLAKASNASNTDVAMMGETFKYVGPIAGALGYSIQDMAVSIGLMANSGIKASMAGTSLRQIIMGLQGDVKLTSDAFGEMIIQTTNADGTMKDFNQIVGELRGSFSQMTEAEKAMNAETIAGKIGMSGLLAIVNATEKDFVQLTDAVTNSAGASKQMSDIMNDTVQGSFKLFTSAVEELCIQLFERLEPAIRQVLEALTGFVEDFMDLPEWFQNLTLMIGGLLIVLGPLLSMLGLMTSAIGKLFTSFSSFSALLSPVGLALAAIAVAVGVVVKTVVDHQVKQKKLNDELEKTLDLQAKGIDATEGSIEASKTEMEVLDKKIKNLKDLQKQYESNSQEYARLSIEATKAAQAQNNEEYQEAYEKMQKLEEAQIALGHSIINCEGEITSQYGTIENAEDRVDSWRVAISNAEAEMKLLEQTTNEAAKATAQEGITLQKTAREAQVLGDRYHQLSQQQKLTKAESKELESIKKRLIDIYGASIVQVDAETGVVRINMNALKDEIAITKSSATAKLEAVQAFNQGSRERIIAQKAETEAVIKSLQAQLQASRTISQAMGLSNQIVDSENKIKELDALLAQIDMVSEMAAASVVSGIDKVDEKSEGASKKSAERQKTALEVAMETYEQKRKLGELSFEEEIQSLEQMRQQHAKSKDDIIQVNEFAQGRIVELIKLRKETEQLTLEEELQLYEQAKNMYCQNEQDKFDFNKLINQAIIEDTLESVQNIKDMNSTQLQETKDMLLDKKYLYEDNKYVVEEIDKQLLEIKKQMYSQEVDELKSTVDKLIAERERQYNEELAIIDRDLQDELDVYQKQLDEIDNLEKEQRKKEQEGRYESKIQKLEEKLKEVEDAKEKQEVMDQIRETELEREKWYADEKLKAEKEAIKQSMNDAKEAAKSKKEDAKEALAQEKELMKEHQQFQEEWLKVKLENSDLTEQQITQKTLEQIEQREKDLDDTLARQLSIYQNQIPSIQIVGNEYGNKLLEGIKSTEYLIDSYIARKISDMEQQINSVSFKGSSNGIPMSGGQSAGLGTRSMVQQASLFDLATYTRESQDSMKSLLDMGQKTSNVKTQFYQQKSEPQTLEVTQVDTSKLEDLLEKVNSKLDRLPKVFRQEQRMG